MLALIAAMTVTPAIAQTTTENASDDDEMTMEEKITAADAPDIAETDTMQERQLAQDQRNDPSASGMSGQSNNRMAMSGMLGMSGSDSGFRVMSLQSLGHDIYERGFRQGYIRGVQEAREDFANRLAFLAKRGQLMESYRDWNVTESTTDNDGASNQSQKQTQNQSQGSSQMNSGSDQTASNSADGMSGKQNNRDQYDLNRISEEVRARPGGSIIVLPAGISPERFIENLVDSREEAISGN
ncbi:MAG: hypothetical protein DCO97_14355 [Marivita sp. XM-24bin2]|jgi:hypothetical protein|nr:MAG: hypothetical protein DCO97_14355 [Marivita sp. XM-24bin2]